MVIKSQKTLKRKTDKHIREQSDGKRSRGGEGGKRAGKLGGQRHVRYTRFTITRRGRSFAGYTRAFLPVCKISFCAAFADEPTSWAVRTFALATYPRSSSDVFSLVLPREEAHKHAAGAASTPATVASVWVALAASLRVCETAGDKWLTEIEALKREVFQVVNNDNRSRGDR